MGWVSMNPPFIPLGPLTRLTTGNRQGSCSWGCASDLEKGRKNLKKNLTFSPSRAELGVACLNFANPWCVRVRN